MTIEEKKNKLVMIAARVPIEFKKKIKEHVIKNSTWDKKITENDFFIDCLKKGLKE